MSAPAQNLVTVNIDGTDVAVPPGTNMIEAAKLLGIEVPHYCYHPKLSVVGNCRMCLVEMGMPQTDPKTKAVAVDDSTGKPKIQWMPRPAIACATTATPGLHIRTNSKLTKECREGVMELLLINHPLDCPICDQAGECRLQEFATDYGRGYSRFIEQKNVKPKRTLLGPRVMLDDERCILCSRCIRFCKEIVKDDVLGFIDRGSYSTLTCYPGRKLENNYSLNTVDICPVGALTSTDFRFKMRVWFLKQTDSICTESSAGTNTVLWSREGRIYRITPRRNDAVNDTWMTDSGRLLYKLAESPDRLTAARVGQAAVAPEVAVQEAARLLAAGPVAVVGSGRSSVEEQFLLARLARAVSAVRTDLVSRTGPGDGLLLTEDRNPNVRGALVTGLIEELPTARLDALAGAIEAGSVKTLFVVNEDLADAGVDEDVLAKVTIVYVGSHATAAAGAARVVLPGRMVFEKSGSFVNQQFRIQRFHAAVPGPAGARDDIAWLGRLLATVSGGPAPVALDEVWKWMSSEIEVLRGLTWKTIPAEGHLLDGSRWSGLPFCEGPSLHYTPAAAAAPAAAA